MTADLVAFLRARLDEDEQAAQATAAEWGAAWTANEEMGAVQSDTGADVVDEAAPIGYIARHDPARVLAEITAKRAIVNAHARPHECIELSGKGDHSVVDGKPWENWEPQHTSDYGPCFVLRTLAAPYAGADGYRPEWAPDA